VPEKWESFIRNKIQSGRYRSEEEVLNEALRLLKEHDSKDAEERARIEALLVEGMDSGPSTPMTSEDWDEVEREGQRIIKARIARKAR
jgi:antitoxin ParD1/3/4